MTVSNTEIEEGSCAIVIFFLLLPVIIYTIKDVSADFKSYLHSIASFTGCERTIPDREDVSSSIERASLLSKSKDSDDEDPDDSDIDLNDNMADIPPGSTTLNPSNVSLTLIDRDHNVLAQTTNPVDQMQQMLLCSNNGLHPKLAVILQSLNNQQLPSYDQSINVHIKPMELMLWLLFLTVSYIALRTMVVTKNMRHNFKYHAVEMQDVWELCLRGIIMYIFGNIAQRVSKVFFLWIGWFVLFYPFVFQICPTSFTIEVGHSMDWTMVSICIFVGVVNGYILLDNFHYVWKIKKWWIYGYGAFAVMIMYHIGFVRSANENIDIHIHHHHWAFVLTLFLHSKKTSSMVMHALLTAIFIHGITVFGCENLFDYKNLEDQNVIDV